MQKLLRVDWADSIIFTAAATGFLVPLSWEGSRIHGLIGIHLCLFSSVQVGLLYSSYGNINMQSIRSCRCIDFEIGHAVPYSFVPSYMA